MFIQVVVQNALRRLNRAVPNPPKPGEAPQHRDRTGFILVLFVIAGALAFAIAGVM